MTGRPRTIQTYLPSGDPRGIRVAELTTSIVRVIEVPRASDAITGASTNGWQLWKTKEGKTLDELKRQPASS